MDPHWNENFQTYIGIFVISISWMTMACMPFVLVKFSSVGYVDQVFDAINEKVLMLKARQCLV